MVYVASLIIYLHNFYRKMNVVEKLSDQKPYKKIKKIHLMWQSFNHYLFNLMIFFEISVLKKKVYLLHEN